MTGVLAIDTATDACSVAVCCGDQCEERYELAPRGHDQRVFELLSDLLPRRDLRAAGIELLAFGAGPGSFTGLRIAASAVQGLAYASGLPAVAVSTLACQAQTALRACVVEAGDAVWSAIDARIGELYFATYVFEDGLAVLQEGPAACTPDLVTLDDRLPVLRALGSGCVHAGALPAPVRARLRTLEPGLRPHARDLIPLALQQWRSGESLRPHQVQPVYVRHDIGWKKLSEQGRPK